jgi:hypothetical protein
MGVGLRWVVELFKDGCKNDARHRFTHVVYHQVDSVKLVPRSSFSLSFRTLFAPVDLQHHRPFFLKNFRPNLAYPSAVVILDDTCRFDLAPAECAGDAGIIPQFRNPGSIVIGPVPTLKAQHTKLPSCSYSCYCFSDFKSPISQICISPWD